MKQNQNPDDPTLVDLYTAYKVDTDLSTQPPTGRVYHKNLKQKSKQLTVIIFNIQLTQQYKVLFIFTFKIVSRCIIGLL
jgi:hypothetical protein